MIATTVNRQSSLHSVESSSGLAPRPVALLGVQLAVGTSAVVSGFLLTINGLGMPQSALRHSPFDGFLVPGLVLACVVGGSLLASAAAIWLRHPKAPTMSVGAGITLLGWIATESIMVRDGRGLQAEIFLLALLTIALAWRARQRGRRRGGSPGPFSSTA